SGATQSLELIGADIAGQRVSLRVRGDININGNLTKNDQSQTATTANQYESTNFQIKQTQAFKIEGKVGDRVSINVDQDSERDFDFENSLQIQYNGTEDEIIQKVEAGNITLNLPATNLATFSSKSNGLFGLKAIMKVGALDITTIASLEKGQQQKKTFSGDEASQAQTVPDFRRVHRKYFFINAFYRRKFYPLNEAGLHILTGRRVVDIEVYKSILPGSQFDDSEIYWGYASVDTQAIARNWVRLVQNQDYTILEDFGVLKLEQPVQTDEVLAIAYRDSAMTDDGTLVYEYDPFGQTLVYQEGTLGEVSTTDTLQLVMLKSDDAQPGQPPWDLELKNVFYLGAQPINKDGFELKIQYTRTPEATEETDDGTNFLQLFGLDLYDESGNLQSDGIMDLDNVNTIRFNTGEVFLPYLHPFMPDTLPDDAIPERTDALGNVLGTGGNPNLTDAKYQSFSFYDELEGTSNYQNDHKFQFSVKYSNKSSVINLGFNLIEGSEEVTLDGRRLQRGPDYQIDYFSGTLTILNEAALAPGAQLEVKYEQHEFFQLDKKIILGSRAEYKFGKNEQSFIGATALFFSKSSIDEKVRIGKEPIQNFIWDVNTKMTYDMNWLTKALDWLPVVKTDKPSTLNIQGEIAQVRPNPNTANNPELGDYGVAYIDDFEGSRRETNLGVQMRNWTIASPPVDVGTGVISKNNRKRGYSYWYNPYHRIPTNQIWPNKETSAQAQNDVTDVLVLDMTPDSSFWVRDDHNDPTESWGGFMRSLSSGYYDQTESKFLEMWVKGDVGRIHVDLGLISEDIQSSPAEQWSVTIDGKTVDKGWGRLDTEDLPSATSTLGDGLVSEAEDVGWDGWRYTHSDTLDWHPSWDFWAFDPNATTLDYSQANGGEGNFNAEGGRYPDTEDLNNNGALDIRNAYFTIEVDLSQDTYIAGRTQYLNGGYTGWKLIRVPLTEFDIAGDENATKWEKIKYARLWMDGVQEKTAVQIATIDLVGNEWQETAGVGVFSDYERQDVAADTILTNFDVSVINTEDNPNRYNQDSRDPYSAPPVGVRGIQDPITGLRSKEQSLVLKAENLLPGHAVSARKQFYDTKDMSHYGTLKMFIHGWDPDRPDYEAINNFTRYEVNPDSSKLEFFLRLTLNNQDDYYEIRKPIFAGWDPRNELKVRMSDLSNFKLSLSDSVMIDTAVVSTDNGDSTVIDTIFWNDFPEARKYASRKLPDGSTIVVKGDPTISQVKYLKTGFRNRDPVQSMTGEIWLDELRVTDVEREIATAAVASASISLADIGSVNLTIDKRDADFHNAQTQFGSGSNSISAGVSGNLALDKFLPENWGLSIPVNSSYRFSERQPKYIPGTDIRVMDLDPSLRDTLNSITDLTTSYSWNVSLSKRTKSDFWLTRYTIDNLSLKLANNQNYSQSSQIAGKTTGSTSGNIRYNLSLGKDFTIQPLRFMAGFPLVGEKISAFTLGYLPSSISLDANGSENQSNTEKRNKNADKITSHTLSLTRNVSVDWPIMPTLNARYSRKMDNNLDSLANQKKRIIETGNLGHMGTLQESYSLAWQPRFLKLFAPNLSYASSYRAVDAITTTTPGVDALVNVTASTSLNVRLSELLGLVYKPQSTSTSGRPPQPSPRGRPTKSRRDENKEPPKADAPKKESKDDKSGDDGPGLIKTVFTGVYRVVEKIDPISISVNNQQSQARNKLVYDDSTEIAINDVDWRYKLGLVDSPGDFATSSLITTPGSENQSVNLSLRSGVKFTKDISAQVTFNHVQREDNSYGTQGVTNKVSYDYLPSGPLFGEPDRDLSTLGKQGVPLPSFSLRWYGLEKVSFIKKFASSMYVESGYRGNQETSYQRGDEFNGQTISANFSPLLGVTMTIKPGINFSLNWNNTRNISNGTGGLTNIKMDQSLTSNIGYSRRSGINIPMPMMDDIYLENNIDFSMSITYSQSKSFQANPDETGARLNIDSKDYSKQIIVNPNINYSFTDRITGRVGYNFTLTDNRISGTRTANKLEFGVRIIIKG
ncbi:MAG: cell surface protein SprA, partial [Candidatus Marinimicrobia bacterium]|nr:cell surface protein SprA [Candidatus Neomarinimicrobiota bacterium]